MSDKDIYLELIDYEFPNVKYVIATHCQHSMRLINDCSCSICCSLKNSLHMSTWTIDVCHDCAYVWCVAYDVRPSHVLNSFAINAYPFDDKDAIDAIELVLSQNIVNKPYGFFPVTDNPRKACRSIYFQDTMIPGLDSVNIVVSDVPAHATSHYGLTTSVVSTNKPLEIIADSGATRHMFHDRSLFTEYRTVENHFVRVANGKMVRVHGIGTVGTLKNVLHVPDIVLCLVSEPQLDREDKICITRKGVKTFYENTTENDAKVFLVANLSDKGLYVVNPTYLSLPNSSYNYACYDALATKAEAIDLLHKTVGHLSLDRLQDSIATGHVNWNHDTTPVNFRKIANPCSSCGLAKSKRSSHTGTLRVPTQPGALVYIDVWGPNETPSLLNENKYTIGIIDATSKRA